MSSGNANKGAGGNITAIVGTGDTKNGGGVIVTAGETKGTHMHIQTAIF